MNEEVEAYIVFLSRFKEVHRPVEPQYDCHLFLDKKYLDAVDEIMREYNAIDDEYLTIKHLKGN